jgi:RNA polymerase sigma factor (sigma-70 family)
VQPVTPPSADALLARLYPDLRRFAGAVRPPHVDPDDLVQEAVARSIRARGDLGALDDPSAYLRRAIVRIAANERRSWRRATRALGRLADREPAVDSVPSDLADLMRVDPIDRAVVYLTAVEGRSYADAAAVLGCSEDAARTRASRARRRLRAELEEEERWD